MSVIQLTTLLKTGIHLGHEVNEWNPKMFPYIYMERDGIHILDVVQISRLLSTAEKFCYFSAKNKKKFLFVGTTQQTSLIVAQEAINCDSYYINKRWLGGMLTNWETLKTRIERLKDLEQQDKDEILKSLPKKEEANIRKELKRLVNYLSGIKSIPNVPDIMIVIDQCQELTAINEARILKIPVISILGTNCDPNLVDIPIPANVDSIVAINLILQTLGKSIRRGKKEM